MPIWSIVFLLRKIEWTHTCTPKDHSSFWLGCANIVATCILYSAFLYIFLYRPPKFKYPYSSRWWLLLFHSFIHWYEKGNKNVSNNNNKIKRKQERPTNSCNYFNTFICRWIDLHKNASIHIKDTIIHWINSENAV